jgi:hypothetical protein
MLKKLPLALMVLLGTCAAQDTHPLTQIQGNSRILMVFASDANSANFKRQLQLIEHHSFELSSRNTVVVPVSTGSLATDIFGGEQFPLSSTTDQVYARARYHVQETEFTVLLLKEDGVEELRSHNPMDIHELTAHLDSLPLL